MSSYVEFYTGDWRTLLVRVKSSIVPPRGELVNIQGATWKVIRITYAVDYSGRSEMDERELVANVMLAPAARPELTPSSEIRDAALGL